MRVLSIFCASLLAAACAVVQPVTPQQYLDELTASTITRVAAPWVFSREGAPAQLDFVHLYALDVNRQGEHRQYLVLAQFWPESINEAGTTLRIVSSDRDLELKPMRTTGRALGIGQHLDPTAPQTTQWSYYELSDEALIALASPQSLHLVLSSAAKSARYVVWQSANEQFTEFAAVAQQW